MDQQSSAKPRGRPRMWLSVTGIKDKVRDKDRRSVSPQPPKLSVPATPSTSTEGETAVPVPISRTSTSETIVPPLDAYMTKALASATDRAAALEPGDPWDFVRADILKSRSARQTSVIKLPVAEKASPAFQKALKDHEAKLSPDEKAAFQRASAHSADSLINQCKALDEKHEKSSRTRRLAGRAERILVGLQPYVSAVTVLCQHSPEFSSLAVGGFKCVLEIAIRFLGFFEKLTRMMERIVRHLSYLNLLSRVEFRDYNVLQDRLVATYGDMLEFCVRTRRLFINPDGTEYRWVSARVFLRSLWDPYENGFADVERKFLENSNVALSTAQVHAMLYKKILDKAVLENKMLKILRERDEERGYVLKSLGARDFEEIHSQHFAKRHGKSGTWLLQSSEYREWMESTSSRLLWCHGSPGVGKTVLTSVVIEDITEQFPVSQHTGVAFAYCTYRDAETASDPKQFLSSFILQLSRQREVVFPAVVNHVRANERDARTPSFSTLREVLMDICCELESLFIVFDALDECTERKELMLLLRALLSNTNATGRCIVKIFITSRKEMDIEQAFTGLDSLWIEASKVQEDIKAYVTSEINTRDELVGLDPELREQVSDSLASRSDGMFLWVSYQLDHICSHYNLYGAAGVKDALQTLPDSLDETYAQILLKIVQQPREQRVLAEKALKWVALASRGLKLRELSAAVAIEPGQRPHSDMRIPESKMLLQSCQNLLSPELPTGATSSTSDTPTEDSLVQFAHYSVKEFLLRPNTERPRNITRDDWEKISRVFVTSAEGHNYLAVSCVSYMVSVDTEPYKTGDICNGSDRCRQQSLLLDYASEHWPYHVEHSTIVPAVLSEYLQRLLEPQSWQLKVCLLEYFHQVECCSRYATKTEDSTQEKWFLREVPCSQRLKAWALCSPRTLVALLGAPRVISVLPGVESCASASADSVSPTAVESVLKVLFRYAETRETLSLLWEEPVLYIHPEATLRVAILLSRKDVVEHVTSKITDPEKLFPRIIPENILSRAVINDVAAGSVWFTKSLLDHGARGSINRPDPTYGTPIQALFWRENMAVTFPPTSSSITSSQPIHGELLNLLVDSGADINQVSRSGMTELGLALYRNADLGLIQLMVKLGADVNFPQGSFGNPLALVVQRQYEHQRLSSSLSESAEVNLAHAELLIKSGAIINRDHEGVGTALGLATNANIPELVELFLKHGADANANDSRYGSALAAATRLITIHPHSHQSNVRIISKLLAGKAETNYHSVDRMSVLQAAVVQAIHSSAHNFDFRVNNIENLLQSGADISYNHPSFGTVLASAAEAGHIELVSFLLKHGADVKQEDSIDGSVLVSAVKNHRNDPEVVRLFLELGCDPNYSGRSGTPLATAAALGRDSMVCQLLESGADPNQIDNVYGSALHAVILTCRRSVYRDGDPLPQGWAMQPPSMDKPEASIYGHSVCRKADLLQPLKTVNPLVAAGADVRKVHPEYGVPSTLVTQLSLIPNDRRQIMMGIERKSEQYAPVILSELKDEPSSDSESRKDLCLRIRPEFGHWLRNQSALNNWSRAATEVL